VSTTRHGNILVWHSPTPERWGAFAGGFEEVDENVWYEEKEDEFDLQDEGEVARRKAEEEDEEVDIDGFDEEPSGRDKDRAVEDEEDEELRWADQEPDEDVKGWKMKIWMDDDEDEGY
jgi:COMPASS component SWD1